MTGPNARPEPPRTEGPVDDAPLEPLLVEGPVDMVLDDGTPVRSDRFVVAICTCRRSKRYPLCDTSHRPRIRDHKG